eukprot:gnl/TRDRNA2_/TRDRNA2_166985_c0_seq3.p1 gnl/TRDRNA2_/TRDRNA2_166985_c0~~gnl/TRDRNA2_/TRDRNA2_166985_c0_seq3.p1  ORF type:complete len:345 (-),score=56.72 gnl/TRDRNA2_/TRDRNA2_166985_c0_seq3:18-1004(-)
METLGMAAIRCLKGEGDAQVTPQILSMLIWSLAELQMPNDCLAKAVAKIARKRVHEFTPRGLANLVWSFDQLGIRKQKLLQKIGAAASLLIQQFASDELLKFVWAYERAGGNDESWAKAVASQCERKYLFPTIGLDVALSTKVPHLKAKGGSCTSTDDPTGTCDPRFRSGMAVWEASFVLSEFLSRYENLAQIAEVKELIGPKRWDSWRGKSGVELGAGLGLPSIVATNLGAEMIATDGDDAVLQLLGTNMQRNAPSCRVEKLYWGSAEPLAALGLRQEPDFVLAADVVYGRDLEVWSALVETIKALAGSDTLVVITNMRRPKGEGSD